MRFNQPRKSDREIVERWEAAQGQPKPLKVEFWQEGGRWWFHAPMVTGGGCRTMKAAFRHAAEALEFQASKETHG